MTLRHRAWLLALVSLLVFAVLVGVFLLAYRDKARTQRDLALTESLSFHTTQLRTALFGYLLHPQVQPRSQVEAQFEVLNALLEREAGAIAATIRDEAQVGYAWEGVRRLVADARALFGDLGGTAADPGFLERDLRTADLLLVDSHSLILFVSQIRYRIAERLLQASDRESLTLAALLAGLASLVLMLFLVLERAVLAPVRRLHTAAVRVSRGESQLRLASDRRDELGELAKAFDRMLDRIQETTVSRNRLEAEVAARKRAELEIQALNADLERRVEQRTAELRGANRELESFAYAVSHDLRAPLRALSGFSQALVEDYAARLDGEALGFLDQIQIASRRMGELIDGILTLSRSTRGDLRRDPVDLSALARRLLTQRAAAQPQRQVDWEVAPGLVVQGDPSMLEVVMVNLIDNAWKYTARTPTATIRVSAQDQDGARWYGVADNGAGFDMAYAERLFQPFQRLHRQDEFPGIGIGLATVQRIVHRHGGIIEAAGTPEGGATFRFTLPATSARPESV